MAENMPRHACRQTWRRFHPAFLIVNDRLTGTVSGLFDSNCVSETDCGQIETHPQPAEAIVDFPETFDCLDGVCGIGPEHEATVTQGEETITFEGLAVFRNHFVAYQLIGTSQESETGPSADPILAFGGKGYDFGTPSGKTYSFTLLPDIHEGSKGVIAPFAGSASSPSSISAPTRTQLHQAAAGDFGPALS